MQVDMKTQWRFPAVLFLQSPQSWRILVCTGFHVLIRFGCEIYFLYKYNHDNDHPSIPPYLLCRCSRRAAGPCLVRRRTEGNREALVRQL
jgi:hypothetical protein